MADRNDEEDIMNQMEEEDQGQEEEQDRTNAAHPRAVHEKDDIYRTLPRTDSEDSEEDFQGRCPLQIVPS